MASSKEEEGKELGFFSRVINIYLAPEDVFRSIDVNPRWFFPLLLCILVTSGATFWFMRTELADVLLYEQFEKAAKQLTEEQIDGVMWFSKNVAWVTPIITIPLFLLFIGGIVYLVMVVAFGSDTTFSRIFSLCCHVQLISIVQIAFSYALVFMRESLQVSVSLAMFFPDIETGTFLAKFLASFDLFIIWQLCLLAFGTAYLAKRSKIGVLVGMLSTYVIFAAGGSWLGAYLQSLSRKA
jgi:hypothetical protein